MDERDRVLDIIERHKERYRERAETSLETWKRNGSREEDENRIVNECVLDALGRVEDEVKNGRVEV